jgi:tetratricopeptide (TPR) repeat protein
MNTSQIDLQKLHEQAESAREEDRLLDALKLYEEVIVQAQEIGDHHRIADALQGRCLTYRHLFLLTNDKAFAVIAKTAAVASLEITEHYKITDLESSCHFRLGEIAMLTDDFAQGVTSYKKALEVHTGSKAEYGDYHYHLGEALYKSGRKEEGKKALFAGLKEIQQNREEVDSFVANVWESGAHGRIAEALREDEPEEAKKHLETAKRIVESDARLIIRRRQVEALEKLF